MKFLKENWLIWIPKIFIEVEIECQTHKKNTYPFYAAYQSVVKSQLKIFVNVSLRIICVRVYLMFVYKMVTTLQDNDIAEMYMIQVGPTTARQWFIIVENHLGM